MSALRRELFEELGVSEYCLEGFLGTFWLDKGYVGAVSVVRTKQIPYAAESSHDGLRWIPAGSQESLVYPQPGSGEALEAWRRLVG